MTTIFRICILFLLLVTTVEVATGDPAPQKPAESTTARSQLAKQMLAETNIARNDPRRYAGYVKEFRGRFIGKMYRLPGSAAMVVTKEGVAALDESVEFLSRQSPLPALSWSPGLARAAAELVREQTGTGATGHESGRSGDIRERIEKYGSWQSGIAENIGYGPDTARLMVMELIIDDGVPDRGHRKNIFNKSFTTAGAACGPHPLYRNMCVMDFAVGFKSK